MYYTLYFAIILENILKGLQLLQIKDKYNISEAAFNEILEVLNISGIILYKLQKILKNIIPLKPTYIDCCINSCIAFTGELADKNFCPECKESRYRSNNISRKKAAYWSPIDSLRMQYKDKIRSKTLQYRHNYTSTNEYINNQIGDIFDGARYKTLVSSGFFSDYRDVALMASTDGYQIFRQKRDDCWVILLINANLPPDIRIQKENLMISALIPGPRVPKNFNSFLQPLVNELKQLQGIVSKHTFSYYYFIIHYLYYQFNTEGVQCFDGITEGVFTLRAHILSLSGDLPALAKVMYTTGHNSYKACQFCSICGIYC